MEIHKKIKQLRLFKNYSQAFVAKELFISQRAYSDLENGKTKLDVERLQILAKLYEIKLSYLFETDANEESHLNQIKHLKGEVEFLRKQLNKEANH